MAQRPQVVSEQARRLAEYQALQLQKAERAAVMRRDYGEQFEQMAQVRGVYDTRVQELTADRMAVLLADRDLDPRRIDYRTYTDIADQAIGQAYAQDEREMAAEIAAGKAAELTEPQAAEPLSAVSSEPTEPEREAADRPDPQTASEPAPVKDQDPSLLPESISDRDPPGDLNVWSDEIWSEIKAEEHGALLIAQHYERQSVLDGTSNETLSALESRHAKEWAEFEENYGPVETRPALREDLQQQAMTDQQPATPDRQAEADPPFAVEQDRPRPIEATPDRMPEVDPTPQPPFAANLSDLREEIRRDARGLEPELDGRHLQPDPPARAINDNQVQPEPSSPQDSVASAPVARTGEPAGQDQADPGRRRLHFYEDLKQEHARATGRDRDEGDTDSDARQREQNDAGLKKLRFHEDRHPTQDHGLEH